MKPRIENLLNYIINKKHHNFRRDLPEATEREVKCKIRKPDMSYMRRVTNRLILFLDLEKPIILPNEKISFLRTIKKFPEIYTEDEWESIKNEHYIHERGKVCNISSDYATTIVVGLEGRRKEVIKSMKKSRENGDEEGLEFLQCVIDVIDAVERLADRYAEIGDKQGNFEVATILRKVPKYGAETFYEALQSFRVLHFTLWCAGNYHNIIGRFDKYMYPYLKADLAAERLDEESAFELVEEFFLTFNRDSDLYPGMQQGDNGQSMMLMGVDEGGNKIYNKLFT